MFPFSLDPKIKLHDGRRGLTWMEQPGIGQLMTGKRSTGAKLRPFPGSGERSDGA